MNLLAVACGGFIGAIARFAAGSYLKQKLNANNFPISTLVVNLTGAFLLGILLGQGMAGLTYAFFGVGFLGAFTTYSTFMVEALNLNRSGNGRDALLYLAVSYGGGMLTAFFGLMCGMLV
ncbi:fluoride efflux transporter FluC [Bacillus salacetis]|uniref:fluoride efflux transporter FluC n=1 Tax=Bacillus salacetis TaxID=2315464 RepID=UPI003BA2B028